MQPCANRDGTRIGSSYQQIRRVKRLLDSASSWQDVAAVGKAEEIEVEALTTMDRITVNAACTLDADPVRGRQLSGNGHETLYSDDGD